MTCTCDNGTRFLNNPTICVHKVAVIIYISEKDRKKKIQDIKDLYNVQKNLKEFDLEICEYLLKELLNIR
jgi:predicted MarR family transcription regulator